jgi:hypothetical protein
MSDRYVYGQKRQELKEISHDTMQAALDQIETDLARLSDANAIELKEILVGVLRRQARIIRGLQHLVAHGENER